MKGLAAKAVVAAIMLCITSSVLNAQRADLPYVPGESLTYVVNYKWTAVNTDVGEAVTSLSYIDSLGLFHSVITGKTYKFYDIIFKVREHFESKFYDDPVRPHYFYRKTQEGRYRIQNTFRFEKDTNLIRASVQKYDREPVDTLLVGTGNTFDIPALFYKVRTIDVDSVAVGVKYPISFAIDDDVYNFYFILVGREEKKVRGLGTFKTLKFAVKLVAGSVFTGKDDMFIWVTDDENKVPLLFESPIIVGRVQGRLVEYSNLKGPLTSKIK
ncbi:MAG: DUF3108 domain-containing protein [Bacteroidales bacterium]|nr:DUF3108 domain-containing protein [Bacteroidales bacterium]